MALFLKLGFQTMIEFQPLKMPFRIPKRPLWIPKQLVNLMDSAPDVSESEISKLAAIMDQNRFSKSERYLGS